MSGVHMIGRCTPVRINNGPWVQAEWRFKPADCLAVILRLGTRHGPVHWFVARELLEECLLTGHAGVGDVALSVAEGLVTLALSTPDGRGEVECPLPELAAFLDECEDAVCEDWQPHLVTEALNRWLASAGFSAEEAGGCCDCGGAW